MKCLLARNHCSSPHLSGYRLDKTMAHEAELLRIETGVSFLTGIECSTPCSPEEQRLLVDHGLVPLQVAQRGTALYFTTAVPEHGTEVVPSAFATVPKDAVDSALTSAPTIGGWDAVGVEIALHDFGLGTAVVTWEPRNGHDITQASEVRVIASLAEATELLVRPLLETSMRGLRAALTRPPRRDGVVSLLRSVEHDLPPFGQALWVWSHLRLSSPRSSQHRQVADDVAAEFCPNDYQLLSHRDHTYATGVSVSVTCSASDRFDDGVALSRILPRQDAWWALVWALDRALLAIQQRLDEAVLADSLSAMAARARQIHTVTAGIQLLRSRIDSILANAGARELAVWTCLSESWHLDRRVEIVQRKLAFLHDGYQNVVVEMSRRRADQVSFMVYVFTAVSVIASAVAVIQYAQGGISSGVGYRATVLAVCVLAACGAVLTSLRAKELRAQRASSVASLWRSLVGKLSNPVGRSHPAIGSSRRVGEPRTTEP